MRYRQQPQWEVLGPEERLERVEVSLADLGAALDELGTALEAHMAETAIQFESVMRQQHHNRSRAGEQPSPSQGAWPCFAELRELSARVVRLEAACEARSGSTELGERAGGPASWSALAARFRIGDRSMLLASHFRSPGDAAAFGDADGAMSPGFLVKPGFSEPEGAEEQVVLDESISLDASIWDCALVVVLHQGCSATKDPRQVWWLGRFNIVLIWALHLFNFVVQFLFIVAIHSMSSINPFADIAGPMLDQRLLVGQAFAHMDRRRMMTSAQRACQHAAHDTMATTIDTISTYLDLEVDKGVFGMSGSSICFLAMLFWVVEMTVELRRCVDLMLVVYCLPKVPRTQIEESGTQHVLSGVTRWHKTLAISLVLLPRFAISFCLLAFGKRFLAGTVDIGELILNTCALEFVTHVDDLIFAAMATRTLMLFTRSAVIQRHRASSHQRGGGGGPPGSGAEDSDTDDGSDSDGSAAACVWPRGRAARRSRMEIFNVLFSITFIIANSLEGYVNLIQPFVEGVASVYTDVCGYNTRFAYLVHPVTSMPVFSQTDFSADQVSLRCFYAAQYEMVRIRAGLDPATFPANDTLAALINGSSPLCSSGLVGGSGVADVACPETLLDDLPAIRRLHDKQWARSAACRDQDVAFAVLRETCLSEKYFSASIQSLGFFTDARSCSDFVGECDAAGDHIVTSAWKTKLRTMCAASCGFCGVAGAG
mmetsp:Transcript_60699/g.174026  ORF Transcript_60699/g.174026 Transcript_60699/m.174026 type:complete len:713 (+) Transcript_60699:138-2276(+)